MRLKQFIEKTHIDEKLARAVVRQFGGFESFQESAEDVANHGIDGGFGGFIYYTDTVKFFRNNRTEICGFAENMASDLGEDMLAMIGGFGCLKDSELSASEIGKAIFGNDGDMCDQIQNAMAWFAGEEVCRSYCDIAECE